MAANKDNPVEEQPQQTVVNGATIQSSGQKKRRFSRLRNKRVLKYFVGLIILALIVTAGWHIYQNSKNVVIGKITITPKQVNGLADEMNNYKKQYKNVSFGKSPHDTARNYLILNAALKTEADKYHVKVTQNDLNKAQPTSVGPNSSISYQAIDSYNNSAQVFANINAENTAYEAKLENKIIAKKDFFIAAIIYDTPYVNNSTNPTPTALREQAYGTMKNKFLPLFQQNKSEKTIISAVDIAPGKQAPSETYFNSMPSVAFYARGCTTANPCFHDLKSKPISGLPAAVSTQSEVDKLTKVGQSTGVFNSEAGFVGVMRLIGKTSGNYGSWDQFLQHYENKYAKGKLVASALLPNHQINSVTSFLTHQLAAVWHFGDSLLWKKAAADPSCTNNSQHLVTINIHAYDQNGGNLSGANVTETRPNAQCPNASGRYVDSQALPNHGPNGGSTNGNGTLTLNDNCYNSPPDWSQSGPSGYTLAWVRLYDSAGYDSKMVVGQNFNGPITEQNAIGKAQADSGVWSNGILNLAGSVTIELHYNNPPTKWTLNGFSTIDGKTGTQDVAPGTSHKFQHWVYNNGPDTANFGWIVQDSSGGSWSNDGQPTGSTSSAPPGGNYYPSSGNTVTVNVKAGAVGTTYCQKIYFSNPNGPSTGWGKYSAQVCMHVVDHPIPHPPTTGFSVNCHEAYIKNTYTDGYLEYISLDGTDSDNGGAGIQLQKQKIDGVWYVITDTTYTAVKPDVSVYLHTYQKQSDGSYKEVSTSPYQYGPMHCYQATCNISGNPITVDGPSDAPEVNGHHVVLAGQQYTVNIPVQNNNPSAYADVIPPSAGGHNFSLTEHTPSAFVENDTNFGLNLGETETLSITYTAPADITSFSHTYYPDMYGVGSMTWNRSDSGECSVNITTYQKFNASASSQTTLAPTTEHPSSVSYTSSANFSWDNPPAGLPNHAVNDAITASFYKKAASGATSTLCSPSSYSNGTFTIQSSPPILAGGCGIPAGSYQAGDEYCTAITLTYSSGYVGPDNGVIGGTPAAAISPSCPRVVNEPYFKVYNSDISAGGSFGSCTTAGGTLAGYADISDPVNATRGSTTQLSALALLKITGVASAKTSANINGSPTNLTFANTGVQVDSTGNESPVLGGQYNGCRTLTNATAPPGAADYSSSSFDLSGKNGGYTHSGNIMVNGGSLGANQNVSLFVDGNIYVSSDIAYGDGWQAGSAPSLVLHATGNIYISPSVHRLAGLYIAQDKSDGSAGKIYTCAIGQSPVTAVDLYSTCKDQLIVTGSFVAKQINLMRTFGSLRDEEPNPAVGAVAPVAPTPGSPQIGLIWGSAGTAGVPPGYGCVHIDETSDSHTWDDNYLCEAPGYNVALAWTHYANNPSPSGNPYDGWDSVADLQAKGYSYCTYWWVPSDPDTWTDNALCANKNIGLTFSGNNLTSATENCVNISESADPNASWSRGGYWLCAHYSAGSPGSSGTPGSPPTPKGPPYTSCSNPGVETDSISCAGEVFEYSPTLYLSSPPVNPPGGGSLQFQSIESLPPVL